MRLVANVSNIDIHFIMNVINIKNINETFSSKSNDNVQKSFTRWVIFGKEYQLVAVFQQA